jgi:hypothetical protein
VKQQQVKMLNYDNLKKRETWELSLIQGPKFNLESANIELNYILLGQIKLLDTAKYRTGDVRY